MLLFSVCLFTVLAKTSLVDKDFFNHSYSTHLTLPIYTPSSFLGSLESLIELVRTQGPALQTPWQPLHIERTIRSRLYCNCRSGFVEIIPHCGISHLIRRLCRCQRKNEFVKSIFCSVPENLFKTKRILYMFLHCGRIGEKRKGCFE